MNTPQKRYSAMHIASPWRSTVPLPDTIDAADRQQLAYMYSGISAGEYIPPAPAVNGTWVWDRWH